jgi:hypothetical protein
MNSQAFKGPWSCPVPSAPLPRGSQFVYTTPWMRLLSPYQCQHTKASPSFLRGPAPALLQALNPGACRTGQGRADLDSTNLKQLRIRQRNLVRGTSPLIKVLSLSYSLQIAIAPPCRSNCTEGGDSVKPEGGFITRGCGTGSRCERERKGDMSSPPWYAALRCVAMGGLSMEKEISDQWEG